MRRLPIVVFGFVMLAMHAYTFFGAPPASDRAAAVAALTAYVVFALAIRVLERSAVAGHLQPRTS